MRRSLVLASLVVIPVVLYACADEDDGVPGPKDVGLVDASAGDAGSGDTGSTDAGQDAPADTGADAAVAVRCTQAELDQDAGAGGGDLTGLTAVDITFSNDGTIQQYTNRCVKVKIDTDITFTGAFSSHPLEPNGGDTPTFIPTQATGTTITFKASTLGTYGFQCNFHPAQMFGAIQVVP